jgi:hypothetical protein
MAVEDDALSVSHTMPTSPEAINQPFNILVLELGRIEQEDHLEVIRAMIAALLELANTARRNSNTIAVPKKYLQNSGRSASAMTESFSR